MASLVGYYLLLQLTIHPHQIIYPIQFNLHILSRKFNWRSICIILTVCSDSGFFKICNVFFICIFFFATWISKFIDMHRKKIFDLMCNSILFFFFSWPIYFPGRKNWCKFFKHFIYHVIFELKPHTKITKSKEWITLLSKTLFETIFHRSVRANTGLHWNINIHKYSKREEIWHKAQSIYQYTHMEKACLTNLLYWFSFCVLFWNRI